MTYTGIGITKYRYITTLSQVQKFAFVLHYSLSLSLNVEVNGHALKDFSKKTRKMEKNNDEQHNDEQNSDEQRDDEQQDDDEKKRIEEAILSIIRKIKKRLKPSVCPKYPYLLKSTWNKYGIGIGGKVYRQFT